MSQTYAVTDSSLAQAVLAYVGAWNEPGEISRRQLLEASFAEDGSYLDPTVRIVGRAALVVHARRFAQRWPGAVVCLTSGIDEHGGTACFTWRVVGPDGRTLRDGIDFVAVDAGGRLDRVIGFFGGYRSPHPS